MKAISIHNRGGPDHPVYLVITRQGQVEGQIHRLKLLKRQSYGRAGFDLLRHRVLARSA
jgi:transposase